MPPRASPYVQMVLATLLFAAMGVCVKFASHDFGTAAVVSARGTVGAVIMLIVARTTATSLRTRVPMLHVRRGLAGVFALSMWFYSMAQLPLATSVTLNYMSSVWMAVFLLVQATFLGGPRIDRRLIAAIAVGFGGVALVLHPTLNQDQIWAGLIGLASGMLSATAYLQVTALGRAGEPEVRVVFYFSLMGSVLGALFWLLPGQVNPTPLSDIPPRSWLALFGVGAFATIAQLLMTRAYARGSTLVNANLQYLGIVHAGLLGTVLFGETLGLDALLGMALIVGSGMVAARLKPAGKPSATSPQAADKP
ncbi:MAG: DMT family transporter [Aquabacterium sp.]|uniref:DMT family transporter n=1 Tax=Aquabacterium sp. TaxID=1872578 RepID=UPI002A361AA8|nr:DMT family transporter [Aquabacterium sp.]MDX9842873.1 DMT family transporter [Aquabacterium sp.]